MIPSLPGDVFPAELNRAATGLTGTLGVQIRKLETDTVVMGRRTDVITERPAGTGNYVALLTAPVEVGRYQVVWDTTNGVLDPDHTAVETLEVTTTLPISPSGLGVIADAAKSHMGETFDALVSSTHYGAQYITGRVEVVKRRVMTDPPVQADEDTLDTLVIDYLGKLVALELMPAAFDYWGRQVQAETIGNDPAEMTTYPDRIKVMEAVQQTLLVQTRADEIIVLPLINKPRLRSNDDGPAIDEDPDTFAHVTEDPNSFPPARTYPFGKKDRVIG
jgi:hypothetical protein